RRPPPPTLVPYPTLFRSDRNVADVLARAGEVTASPSERQDLAAFIHLCGAGPATAFARRHFQMTAGERCGDHLVAAYLARVNAKIGRAHAELQSLRHLVC